MRNDRTCGERAGWWTGVEVERTQFYGLRTRFFSRLSVACAMVESAEEEHLFFAVINPKFFDGRIRDEPVDGHCLQSEAWAVIGLVRCCLEGTAKKATVEIPAALAGWRCWNVLRVGFPDRFCLLVVVEVPQPELGAFAVKVAPSNLFTDTANEGGVVTISSDRLYAPALASGRSDFETSWDEYAGDVDGA